MRGSVNDRHADRKGRRGRRRTRRGHRDALGCLGRVESPAGLRAGGVLRLGGGGRGGAFTELAAGGFAGPRPGIDLAHDAQPLLGLGQRREVTHVEAEALAPFLEAAAHEEVETLELGQLSLRQRQRRGR
jgi:hypothetical protein